MRYTHKFTLEIKMKDFYENAIPLIDKFQLKKEDVKELRSNRPER